MANAVVEVTKREIKGGKFKAQREAGQAPGIIYGHNKKFTPELIQFDEKQIKLSLEAGKKMFEIKGLGEDIKAMVKEVQVNEITDKIVHIDFQRVEAGDELIFKIPIVVKGTPEGAKIGGRLQMFLHDIKIACSVENFMEEFVLDVSEMQVLDRVTLGDVKLPSGVKAVGVPTTTVCIIHEPKGTKPSDDPDGEEGEAGAEGEAKKDGETKAEDAKPEDPKSKNNKEKGK
jgi:large subunit ribosomal protein L25